MYSDAQKEEVIKMFGEEMEINDIEIKTSISVSTIQEWKNSYDQTIDDIKAQIKQLSQEEKFDEAEKVARELVKLTPKNIKSKSRLIQVLIKAGKLDEAEDLANKVLIDFPDNIPVRNQLATIKLEQGNFVKAEELCLYTINEMDSDNIPARGILMKIYKEQGESIKVEELYREIIGLDPDNIPARVILIKMYKEQDELIKVEGLCNEIIGIIPNDLPARCLLISIYKELEDFIKVENVCKQIINLYPKNLPARYQLIAIYEENEDKVGEIERLCKEIIRIDPNNLQARSQLIKIYRKPGNEDKLEKVIKDILRINPKDKLAVKQLEELYKQLGREELVIKDVLSLEDMADLEREMLVAAGIVEDGQEETQSTLPQKIRHNFRRGVKSNEITFANISDKEKELKENLNSWEVAMLMAEAYIYLGMGKEAKNSIKEALSQNDSSDEIKKILKEMLEVVISNKPVPILMGRIDTIHKKAMSPCDFGEQDGIL